MVVVLVLVVALACLIIAIRVLQRRRRDEIRSIHHYHDRLDTLHVEQHDRGGSVRVVHGEPELDVHGEPIRPRLDPNAAHLDLSAPATPLERRRRHDRDWAIERMQPRARVDTATVLVIAIVGAVLVAIALAGYLIQRGRGTSTTTTVPSQATTTTLQPASYVPLATHHGIVVYALPHGTYTMTVHAVGGAVWVAVTSPLATTPVARTIAVGTTSTFTLSAPTRVELGAPAEASVSINSSTVTFPSPLTAPLTIQFSRG